MNAFSANETSSAKWKKGVALTSDHICLQRLKEGTLYQFTHSYEFIEFTVAEVRKTTIYLVFVSNKIAKGEWYPIP